MFDSYKLECHERNGAEYFLIGLMSVAKWKMHDISKRLSEREARELLLSFGLTEDEVDREIQEARRRGEGGK